LRPYDLPRSVRERAVAAVLRCQTWARKEAKYSARIKGFLHQGVLNLLPGNGTGVFHQIAQ